MCPSCILGSQATQHTDDSSLLGGDVALFLVVGLLGGDVALFLIIGLLGGDVALCFWSSDCSGAHTASGCAGRW